MDDVWPVVLTECGALRLRGCRGGRGDRGGRVRWLSQGRVEATMRRQLVVEESFGPRLSSRSQRAPGQQRSAYVEHYGANGLSACAAYLHDKSDSWGRRERAMIG
jgi:hypothetical protein